MNIKGIGSQNIVNLYTKNTNKVSSAGKVSKTNDTIEISNVAKKLSTYSFDDVNIDNSAKVEALREKIQNGTYNVDARLTAQSIMDIIKEKKV
ncbi:MAG: flagellar biosynthesis anti-sigma factor FlgM [Clostridium sp.]|uniref:flagellar biosynthesis anti-sigma factor FlgM n=1 Tax=Clostridium sp. DSM 8431 TaxID=1761781 RepID=UPI0008E86EF6|nr:flagellar biosynthesis anti-sigma factor FlgM [Clostridium sp. DSM 8431]MCR4943235.1 flagellar biosynthesis anti-sigma factor FlgM [Clostridium sp.]SFU52096.1 anti-sigma-28 factor, FlgM family [Clostridium sp. DSM 8431]